ncbi:hypothetical protein [Klebsiella phage 05F01]|nr:hypothetical protein [Klebsiella phage 05F01]
MKNKVLLWYLTIESSPSMFDTELKAKDVYFLL